MKRKAFEAQHDRIEALAAKWLKPLGLLWWNVDICYYKKAREWRKGHGENVAMKVFPDWRYRRATIEVNAPLIANYSDAEVERFFVHECMHIMVNEMQPGADDWHDHEERVCETLAQAFVWVWDESRARARMEQEA